MYRHVFQWLVVVGWFTAQVHCSVSTASPAVTGAGEGGRGGTYWSWCCHPWSHRELHRGAFASSSLACNITWSLCPWAGDLKGKHSHREPHHVPAVLLSFFQKRTFCRHDTCYFMWSRFLCYYYLEDSDYVVVCCTNWHFIYKIISII